jgi:putative DNA primase/helicase
MKAVDVLDRLEQVTGGNGKWMACCPAHQDKSPSLAISETEDRVLVYCFAGCGAEDVMAAIGLNVTDLFYSKLAGCELTERKRQRFKEVLKHERLQVAIINSVEKIERPLTPHERERRLLGQQRINKIDGALYE